MRADERYTVATVPAGGHGVLRRVGALIAEGAPCDDVFTAIAQGVAEALDVPSVTLGRYEPHGTTLVLASANAPGFPVGSSRPLAGVCAPIAVEGDAWGLLCVSGVDGEQLPDDTADRLRELTELVATAIASVDYRDRLRRLSDERDAVRRVASLVSAEAPVSELFASVVREVVALLDVTGGWLLRYEPDRAVTVAATVNDRDVPAGSRLPVEDRGLAALVLETGRPVRIDDLAGVPGTLAAQARGLGLRAALGVPIAVAGGLWGLLCVGTTAGELLPADAESRLRDFVELVAFAISNAESRGRLRRLADGQTGLRRLATLVAEDAPHTELFAAALQEVARVLDVQAVSLNRYEADRAMTIVASLNSAGLRVGSRWALDGPSVSSSVFETGRPARVDDYVQLDGRIAASVRDSGVRSAVGAPIVADGSVWGLIWAGSNETDPLPQGAENRLRDITELAGIAISNTASRDRLRRLVDQQAALRRVATLVAEDATPAALFAAVAEEVARILDAEAVSVVRYEPDGTSEVVASVNDESFPVDSRWPPEAGSLNALVLETKRPVRIDDYADVPGTVAAAARTAGIESGVAVPIVVDGRVWGMVAAGRRRRREALPAFTGSYTGRLVLSTDSAEEIESRLAAFTELVGTAISRAQAHDDLRLLADEQASLRRVATLVAEGASPGEIFTAVVDEVARILGLDKVEMVRYEPDGTATVIGASGDHPFPPGSRWPLDGPSIMSIVHETGRPARIDDYGELGGKIAEVARAAGFRSAVGAPIVVDGRTWGTIIAISTSPQPIPERSEARLAQITDLVATAISNATAHSELRTLADEQAALHRIAALVAGGAGSQTVFDAVCAEACTLLGATSVNLSHYTPDGVNVTLAGSSANRSHVEVGTQYPIAPDTVAGVIVRTRAPVRVDDWDAATSELALAVKERGIRSSLGAPVVVERELWGALVAHTDADEPLPPGTEARLARFTELIATAISNAATRSELIASRARIVAAGDEARRRIERNLHDGTQQRLIALGLDLQAVRATLPPGLPDTEEGFDRLEREIESVLEDVRELSRGLHPARLARAGLAPALRALVRRSPIPVELDLDLDGRPPASIETAVYYVVSEALTNAIRHSRASAISVRVATDGSALHATIADDGVGGAERGAGSGLTGLSDRVAALGGRFALESPPGAGTTISVDLPLLPPAAP